jgi:hypothetical protein
MKELNSSDQIEVLVLQGNGEEKIPIRDSGCFKILAR